MISHRSVAILIVAASLGACGGSNEEDDAGEGAGGSDDQASSGAGASGADGPTGAGGTASGGGPADGGAPRAEGPAPKAEFLPAPHGRCPEFVGPEITLNPEQGPRVVKLWISEAAQSLDGPLVFNWHGWHGSPGGNGIDATSREELLAMGGMLIAPYIDPADEDEYWDMDDVLLADEVLACAIEKVGVDLRRIHSVGLSAGGRQSLLLAYQRSGYIASIVTYSPGTSGGSLVSQDPSNRFAAMISHGGMTEDAIFQQLAEQYFDGLVGAGHFAVMCQHESGHSAPSPVRDRAWELLLAHPFGTDPSPYADGLPPSFPSYCRLTK